MENLGNYRFCRQLIGYGGTRKVLSEHKSELECRNSCNNTFKITNWGLLLLTGSDLYWNSIR